MSQFLCNTTIYMGNYDVNKVDAKQGKCSKS